MNKYFGQVNFVIEAENADEAEEIQQEARLFLYGNFRTIVDARADEPVEVDEFGHAG